ncbi:hypothetical protein A2955_03840 [Candidatus Woesebacteria bacterium RIFCSPLOWO2_01_FULL_37_19]|uniref:BrnT family toxin n=2 Tax=Candidatus Woeseibacteriota TaxID=1752722 RepID=A0A1F8AXZ5_9BACT|nr:MAG: hypothetical protein A2771_02410 [Candidatus Woesebacteria bacterium RIFCSPHIGHO2_01_FULL_38_26b]OGM56634.1 MAG: hypothetical protein A2955_03840 [Candidatus Woesebacteria bacterium RIFCSPLOWO2_01_FULL_37_19]
MMDFKKLEGFEWDKGNLEHIKKHGVDYRECEHVFSNKPLLINDDEKHSEFEKRFRAYGRADKNRLMCVIFMIRKNRIRVISARDQNKKERKEYLEKGGGSK